MDTWSNWYCCSFNVKGKSAHEGPISGSVSTSITKENLRISHINGSGKIEGKYTDKAAGKISTSYVPSTYIIVSS